MSKENTLAFITHSPETFPEKEPQIDEMQLARRKRRRTSPRELSVLEAEFRKCSKPCKQDREEIAHRVGMTEKAVQIWFQNKRQSTRKARATLSTPSSINKSIKAEMSTHELPLPPLSLTPAMTPTPQRAHSSHSLHRPAPPQFARPASPEPKRLRLTMSEDGKAQVVMRSPLQPLQNRGAARTNSLPSYRELERRETECANNLLFLSQGRWD